MDWSRLILGLLSGGFSELFSGARKTGEAYGSSKDQGSSNTSGYFDDLYDEIEKMIMENSQQNGDLGPSYLQRYEDNTLYKDIEGNGIADYLAKMTGSRLTTAEQQANQFNMRERIAAQNFNHNEAVDARLWQEYTAQNKYQWEIQSMQNAGVNPAMVMGQGSLVPTQATSAAGSSSPASSVSPGSGSLGDLFGTLLSIVRMPVELKKLNAEIGEINANRDLTRQREQTEKWETVIRRINANYQDRLNGQTLQNLVADYDNTVADTGYKTANKDYVVTQKDAQEILNKYLDERQQKEIKQIEQNIDKMSAEEKKTKAEKTYQDWYNGFVESNGFLPSSNDWLLIGTYVASLFGVAKEDVQNWFNEIMDNIPGWTQNKRKAGKGGATDATGVPHAGSEGSTGKLSR